MKKTFSLSIGGSLFHVEEDAYEKLESYINQMREHFTADPNGKEILEDIEGRIAEKFSEKKSGIVTMADVDGVIETMGTVEQFDDENRTEGTTRARTAPKKLYRDKDNTIVAGVSSGLGHFFGVDPIVFRLLFALSVFVGGTGIIVYIILWILVPEAQTASQKLSMKGSPATISAMADMIKEKIDEVNTPQHKSNFKKLAAVPLEIIRSIINFITRNIFPIVRIVLGLIITCIGLGLAFGATIGLIFALFHISPEVIEGPFLELANSTVSHVFVLSLYLLTVIPLSFIISLGGYMLTKRSSFSRATIVSLLAVWFIALPIAGASGARIAIRGTEIARTDPYYKSETTVTTVAPFTRLVVTDSQSVRLVQGDTYTVEMRGPARGLPNKVLTYGTGTLTLSEKESAAPHCLFCDIGRVETIVTVQNLDSITITDASHVFGEYDGAALSLIVDNSSSARLNTDVSKLTVIADDSSRVYLTGSALSCTATATNNSRIDANMFESSQATVKASSGSHVLIYAKDILIATATNGSRIEYAGSPAVTRDIDLSSNLQERNQRLNR